MSEEQKRSTAPKNDLAVQRKDSHRPNRVALKRLRRKALGALANRNRSRYLRARKRPDLQLDRGDIVQSRDGRKYEILRELGRGAFGAVYRVSDPTFRVLALKILKRDENAKQEAKCSQLISDEFSRHDHIVHIFSVFETTRGNTCILMEYLPLSLQQYLDVYPRLDLHIIRLIVAGVLLGLYALKQVHLIHADIKPNNIMLVEADHCIRAKIIDFGICELSTEGPHAGLYIQARPYRAPEIFLGYEVTHAIDIWSFGVCVTEMCIGETLFDHQDTIEAFRSMLWQVGLDDISYIQNAPNRDRFFEPAEDGYPVFRHGPIPENAAKLDTILMRSLDSCRTVSLFERVDFVDLVVKMVCFDHRSRISVEEALLQNFVTMRSTPFSPIFSPYMLRHMDLLQRSCPTLLETAAQLERLDGVHTQSCTTRPHNGYVDLTSSDSQSTCPASDRAAEGSKRSIRSRPQCS